MTPESLPRVLIVDDNAVDRERIRRLLGSDYEVLEAATAKDGVSMSGSHQLDCVLLDHRLPDRDGVDVIRDFAGYALPVLILTAQGSEHVAVEAMKRGAVDYLSKSALDRERLRRAVQGALESVRLRREIDRHARERETALLALERKRLELESANRALLEREAQLRMMLEQVPALLWTTDRDLRYTSLAGADPGVTGLDRAEALGRSVGEGVSGHDHARAAHEQALAGEAARYSVAWKGMTYECSVEPMCAPDGAIIGTIAIGVDVSEARSTEQQLHHAAKMEALGKLSGGVAHDFNNVLSAIISFTELARAELHEADPIREDLDEVLQAANRAVALVRQLLSFSRQDRVVPRVVSLGPVVAQLLPMLRRLCGEDLRIDLTQRDTLTTWIDRGRLEQVIINLVVNARDAMPQGGVVEVTTRDDRVDELRRSAGDNAIPPGEYVVLVVRDRGMGMPAAVVERIFEPFFTTKAVGHGTGLGLSTVHGIVRQAGGTITVETELGRGTTFHVHFPRTTTRPDVRSEDRADPVPGGSECILVVEDEDQVRAVAVRCLRRLGYEVLEAARPDALAELLARHADRLDLLLTDVVMPEMRGPEVAALVLARAPRVTVAYMSGYSDESMRGRTEIPEGAPVIEKPLRPDVLGRAVRGILDARSRPHNDHGPGASG